MVEVRDHNRLGSKCNAITAFLPHAVSREQDGEPEMLDTFLHAARASKTSFFCLNLMDFVYPLLSKTSPHGIVLISCHLPWWGLVNEEDYVQLWAAATSAVPPTEDLTWSVVDVLLQIASIPDLSPHIPTGVWSWMLKQPSLPHFCYGHVVGTGAETIKTVQGLKDIEVLKSYFHVIWSEWNTSIVFGDLKVLKNMDAILYKNFSGSGMDHHRADLIQRLDHILGELDQGLDHLQQHIPSFNANRVQKMKHHYGELRNILLKMNVEAITCMSDPVPLLFFALIPMDAYRIPCNTHVCTPSPVSVAFHLPFPLPYSICICTYAHSSHVLLCPPCHIKVVHFVP